MPRKNIVKNYQPDSIYHIYNRGVDKRIIFQDEQDYKVFLALFKQYLSPPPPQILKPNNALYKDLKLVAYCLMPNHFHLLLKQVSNNAITQFMRRLCTNYVMYVNRKYERVGTLFESVYKAALIKSQEQLTHLSRYIHLNPKDYKNHPYSSYKSFIDKNQREWLNPNVVLDIFQGNNATIPKLAYENFVKEFEEEKTNIIQDILLE